MPSSSTTSSSFPRALFGAAYGLAVGVTNAVVAALVVRSRPVPGTLHRVLAPASVLGVLPLPWLPGLGAGPPVKIVSSGLTGSPVADFFVMAIFPLFPLAPFASWVGRRLGNWYAGAADGGVGGVGST